MSKMRKLLPLGIFGQRKRTLIFINISVLFGGEGGI